MSLFNPLNFGPFVIKYSATDFLFGRVYISTVKVLLLFQGAKIGNDS